MRKLPLIVFVIFLAFLTGASFSSKKNQKDLSKNLSLQTFPDVKLVDYQGRAVELEQFKGKPLVINSWASWCPYCRTELPRFVKLQTEFKDNLIIIAVDRAEPASLAKKYTDNLKISDKLIFLVDPNDDFYRRIGGTVMPETIFVNKAGEIVYHHRGEMQEEEMRQKIQEIL